MKPLYTFLRFTCNGFFLAWITLPYSSSNGQIFPASRTTNNYFDPTYYLDVSDYLSILQDNAYNPPNLLTYLVVPGELCYSSVLKELFLQRHSQKEWNSANGNVPVFDSLAITCPYIIVNRWHSIIGSGEYPDSTMLGLNMKCTYRRSSVNAKVQQVQISELKVSSDGMKTFHYRRSFFFYDSLNRLEGILTQNGETYFDKQRISDKSRLVFWTGTPIQISYQQDSVVISVLNTIHWIMGKKPVDNMHRIYNKTIGGWGWEEDSLGV